MVRWVSPATTSTSSGGNTVRAVVAAMGADGEGGTGALAWAATWCFGFVTEFVLAAVVPGCEATLAMVVVSAGWSDSASGDSGNQKSRSCQSTMLRASRSRQSDPSINFRCLESWATSARGPARKGRSAFGTMLFISISDMLGTEAA